MASGIYSIVNTVNGNRYVGSVVNIQKRWVHHQHKLRKNKHHNTHLQRAWNKYGEDVFCFEVLEYAPKSSLLEREQLYLDRMQPAYNIAKVAGINMLGVKHKEETKKKMSKAAKGKPKSTEHRASLSAAKTGKKYGKRPKSWRENISKALKEVMKNVERPGMQTAEYKAKQSARMKEIWAARKQGGNK
jgi:group I intron endonuclease